MAKIIRPQYVVEPQHMEEYLREVDIKVHLFYFKNIVH